VRFALHKKHEGKTTHALGPYRIAEQAGAEPSEVIADQVAILEAYEKGGILAARDAGKRIVQGTDGAGLARSTAALATVNVKQCGAAKERDLPEGVHRQPKSTLFMATLWCHDRKERRLYNFATVEEAAAGRGQLEAEDEKQRQQKAVPKKVRLFLSCKLLLQYAHGIF